MDPVSIIVLVGLFGWLGYETFKPRKRNRGVLDEVAAKYGGRIIDGNLHLTIDGLAVEVRAKLPRPSGDFEQPGSTTWRVTVPPPGTTPFSIYPEGFVSFASKVFGGEDLELRLLPTFDHAFMIKSVEPDTLRRMWTTERCAVMTANYMDAKLHGKDDIIELEWPGHAATVEDVMRGVGLLVGLARADLYGMAALEALPDARRSAHGYVEFPGPGSIQIGPRRIKDRMVTVAWASVELPIRTVLPAVLGNAELGTHDGGTAIGFSEIVEDPARLAAAVEFLRGLVVAPSEGVFR